MALQSPVFFLLLLLLLSVSFFADASSITADIRWGISGLDMVHDSDIGGQPVCDGLTGECLADDDVEDGGDVLSEVMRRGLWSRPKARYISYDALKKDRVPCSRRGSSYYNCNSRRRANPYRRGCSYITRCARNLN